MTFFKFGKAPRWLVSLLLLSAGAAAGFGLGIFCGAEPVVGCRESDLTPLPDESFVSPVPASSVQTPPEPEPLPDKWVCLTFDDGPSKTTPDVRKLLPPGIRSRSTPPPTSTATSTKARTPTGRTSVY